VYPLGPLIRFALLLQEFSSNSLGLQAVENRIRVMLAEGALPDPEKDLLGVVHLMSAEVADDVLVATVSGRLHNPKRLGIIVSSFQGRNELDREGVVVVVENLREVLMLRVDEVSDSAVVGLR